MRNANGYYTWEMSNITVGIFQYGFVIGVLGANITRRDISIIPQMFGVI